MPTDRIPFTYWSDPLCVWALVAQPRLDALLRDYGAWLAAEYRVVPVFGSVRERLRAGPWAREGLEGRVVATRRIAEQAGRTDVSGECWRRATPATSWAPAAASKAVSAAVVAGEVPAEVAPRYTVALREAFFVSERNPALRSVQLEVAEALGVPRAAVEARLDDGSALAAVWEDHAERERLKLQGSPTFVFDGGRAMLYGNFPSGLLHGTVDQLLQGLYPGGSVC